MLVRSIPRVGLVGSVLASATALATVVALGTTGQQAPSAAEQPAPTAAAAPVAAAAGAPSTEAITETVSDTVRVARRAVALTVTAPNRVQAGQHFVITGRTAVARPARARVVRLQEKQGRKWKVIASQSTTASGTFSIRAHAGGRAATRVVRVVAPKAKKLRAVTGRPMTVRVVGAPVAAGNANNNGDWSWGGGFSHRARWNPCTPITWSYAGAGQPYASLGDIQSAFNKIATHTGLTFRYVGNAPAMLDTRWSDAAHDKQLAGGVAGYGRYGATSARSGGVAFRIVDGSVVLDRQSSLRAGFSNSGNPTWGQVITHEILHALGLGHAAGARQLMYPMASPSNHSFGAGDLAGMRSIGAAGGCVS